MIKTKKKVKTSKTGKTIKSTKTDKVLKSKKVKKTKTKALVMTAAKIEETVKAGVQVPEPVDNDEELAIRYRPKILQEVAGLDINTKASLLKVFIARKLASGILFTGPSGVGKTTLGRMLGRYANCETRSACGKCESCLQIVHPDVLEINAANTRGVDEMRALIDRTKYSPRYRHRIILLDEAHQLTPQASQLLLKPVEDAPRHITWVICTSEPQKLLPTLRGRCLQFNLRPIDPEPMTEYLLKLWAKERRLRKIDKSADPKSAINLIVNSSNGQMRDAVKSLELALMAAEQGVLDASQLRLQVFQQLNVAVDRAAVKIIYNLLAGKLDRAASAVFDVDGQARQLGQKARYLIEKLLMDKLGKTVQFQDMAYKDAKKLLKEREVSYGAMNLLRILQVLTDAETMLTNSSLPERHVMLSALYRASSGNADTIMNSADDSGSAESL